VGDVLVIVYCAVCGRPFKPKTPRRPVGADGQAHLKCKPRPEPTT
jgi:hypothetical protein